MDRFRIYDRLLPLVLAPERQLEVYGFPLPDPSKPGLKLAQEPLENQFGSSYECIRCKTKYCVDEEGKSMGSGCVYHARTFAVNRNNPDLNRWPCCGKKSRSATGCKSNRFHVNEGETLLENYKNHVKTRPKPELEPNKYGVFALNCDMCYTVYGRDLTRVTVIDHENKVVYEELVKPTNFVLDYNAHYSGVKKEDVESATKTLADVQRDLLELISDKTILVGHSLCASMKVLRIFHSYYVDTTQLYPHPQGLPCRSALRTLMGQKFGVRNFQQDGPQDSSESSRAALRLAIAKTL